MDNLQDSFFAIVVYHSVVAVFFITMATIICVSLAALMMEMLEDFVRAVKRKTRERVRAFLAAARESRVQSVGGHHA